MRSETLTLACDLIKRPSVTPDDQGCQTLMADRLKACGFQIEAMRIEDVDNLWAVHGQEGPLLVFAGHTDVVPTGDSSAWTYPPFEPTEQDGMLYGRGAADMKGSLAAMIVATERFVRDYPDHQGRLGYLITSDEEGDAYHGTVAVMERLTARGERIDWAVVGEPSSTDQVGDVIKNGRRGSMLGYLTIKGKQGHVAYPHLAKNPVHLVAPAIADLSTEVWDEGNDFFPATSFQVSNINSGTGASNVIPGTAEIMFSFRFSTEVTAEELQQRARTILDRHGFDYELRFEVKGQPFLTDRGALVQAAVQAVTEVTGQAPELSTAGGTSDGRFIAPTGAQVVELGPVNRTIHQIDECVASADLDTLTEMYYGIMVNLLANR
ncbi:succinyl-diaminopimelate desuccinylase [Reinekea blandensis]|uniref:Succinyl-diaminopimelate desuccinylase n=1 Tax=Reinekea blandensis MED297 TaxID=314283 RepID=A4BC14_9GAMM|nr:succinyl-diaminopimelate desuccinylase [Reinekea blandensis]EAR10499.1 succinyl-diaminopimelate desuccinylase [Reinekea sp. MED297] [Reinekea blandensis MED297]